MRARVSFCDAALTLAAVHVRPAWWDRLLFGASELDSMAASVADPGGARRWLWDSTGRRIANSSIVAALERERRRVEAEQRIAVAAVTA